jgi:hypothetical protein
VDALSAIAAADVIQSIRTEEGLAHARRAPDRLWVQIGVVAQRVRRQMTEMALHHPKHDPTPCPPATCNIKPDEAVLHPIRAIQQQPEFIVALTARLETLEAATSAGGRNA